MTIFTVLLIVSICVLFFVLYSVVKNKMNIRYAMVWILWAIGVVVISIFPEIIAWFGALIGIQYGSNVAFLIFIFLLYCLVFYVYLKLSKHNEDIINLNYEIAVLKKELEEKRK